ncbi:hypothetical protein SAMN06265375_101434 [Muriicola jejuensis]|uniref:Uncharacterized protein n=1 Tax=Muriicola jejuensis TaxID=504488 RepID=A0A6P0U9Z4_9FLAO|nr:hypothetical protein [Muriicola jejuensis]NER10035.1 hypothetical protein [Muriicola jejuensis]SMP03577.1 hypothetical protein SAMN06265375_101434 [Muriicola jejuensis]
MVTIADYKTYQREDGTDFQVLVVQGEVEAVRSKKTGKLYLTAKTAKVACTFDASMCQALIGTEMDGRIKKVKVDPYEYAIPETGEIITLNHRYEFVSELDDLETKPLKTMLAAA